MPFDRCSPVFSVRDKKFQKVTNWSALVPEISSEQRDLWPFWLLHVVWMQWNEWSKISVCVVEGPQIVKIWHQMDDSSFLQRCQFCMLAMYNGYMHKCICVYLYDYANQMYVYILWIYFNIYNCTPWSVNVLINRPMQWSHCHSTNSAAWVPEMHTHNIWN